jgi:outer membrane protein OmpA-like peptidoglycan-associated protein
MKTIGQLLALCSISLLFLSTMSYGADVKGSADHPLLTRFTGAEIAGYHSTNYDEIELPAGKVNGLSFEQTHLAKGKVTQVVYAIPAGKTATEVMANYADAMAKAGFKPFFSCKPGTPATDCGGMSFAQVYADPLLGADPTHRNRMISLLYAANSNIRYLGATLQHGDATVDVGVMVSGPDDSQAGVLLVIVEHGAMDANQVTVDADAMSKGLAAEGKIALYGLTFDTDSAKLTPSSDATLKQMSELLHKQPSLKVYIVGHTDDTGALAHNLTLSQQRAESVVKALTTTYGIAANRLAAKGLASYAPVASNHSDAGKAKNRRVELVEQ